MLWLALGCGAVAVATTHHDYGATWDEGVTSHYGETALQYFESGGADKSCNEYFDLRFYGPLIDMIPALAYDVSEPGKYEVRHLFLGLLSLLIIPGVWLYARRFGPWAAVFAALGVATLPRFYGHWFSNSKDMPFAVLVLWFMYAVAVMFTGPRVRWRSVVGCGVALGLALCARPGGFPLFGLFLFAGAATWLVTREDAAAESIWVAAWRLLPKTLAVFCIGWPIMVAPWPWAHESVILHPVEAMQVAAKFHTTMPVMFEGINYRSDQLPWYYVIKYVLIGTPLPVLALAGLGLLLGIREQVVGWRTTRSRMMTLTQVWLFIPVLIFVVLRPNVYGGMRHFLFILPPLGVLAAVGAAAVVGRLQRAGWGRTAAVILVATFLLPVREIVRLHPYQATYYNSLVGGVGGASDRYWTDFSLSSYREAISWVNARAAESPERELVAVIAAGPMVMLWALDYPAANVKLVSARDVDREEVDQKTLAGADYYIGNSRNSGDQQYPDAQVVHTIGRDGAVFTVIKAPR